MTLSVGGSNKITRDGGPQVQDHITRESKLSRLCIHCFVNIHNYRYLLIVYNHHSHSTTSLILDFIPLPKLWSVSRLRPSSDSPHNHFQFLRTWSDNSFWTASNTFNRVFRIYLYSFYNNLRPPFPTEQYITLLHPSSFRCGFLYPPYCFL